MPPKTSGFLRCGENVCATCRFALWDGGMAYCAHPKNIPIGGYAVGGMMPRVSALDRCADHEQAPDLKAE